MFLCDGDCVRDGVVIFQLPRNARVRVVASLLHLSEMAGRALPARRRREDAEPPPLVFLLLFRLLVRLLGNLYERRPRRRCGRDLLAPKGTRRTRGAQKWMAAVAFLAKQGDNGIVWTVLSYWRATT